MRFHALLRAIATKKTTVGIIGLGYVGLPLAVLFAQRGFSVTGYLRDKKKVALLNKGENYLQEYDIADTLRRVVSKGVLRVEQFPSDNVKKHDVLIICVPTPIDYDKRPDITALKSVARELTKRSIHDALIVNESTVAPGMTREILGHFSKNNFLACSPERVDPGNKIKTVATIPKLVGGINGESQKLGVALYKSVLRSQVLPVSSLETAEMTKMLENTYRAVNIGLINEFALLCQECDLDILEVVRAARTKWSYHPHYPGIGVGGHCIPVDPYYLLQFAKKLHVEMPIIKDALERNEGMATHLSERIFKLYHPGATVVVYGISYKKNVRDIRESPVMALCENLRRHNIQFSVYDPLFSKEELRKSSFIQARPTAVDIFIVGTDHDELSRDYPSFIDRKTIVVDGRNFFSTRVGKIVYGVGRTLV